MRVYVENYDGSRELLFEVDEDAVDERLREEENERYRQALIAKGYTEEFIGELDSGSVEFARLKFWIDTRMHYVGDWPPMPVNVGTHPDAKEVETPVFRRPLIRDVMGNIVAAQILARGSRRQ